MTDPIVTLARWLGDHLEWFRHREEVDEFLSDVERCARVVRGLARGPRGQRFLGPCGALLAAEVQPCPDGCGCRSGPRTALSEACAACSCLTACHPKVASRAEGQICDGDVYGPRDGKVGRCKACGATVGTAERDTWLDEVRHAEAFSARDIADAYRIPVKTIRTWANRGQLRTWWRTDGGLVAEWPPPDGTEPERLHYVGDVLDLATAAAVERAEREAARARRKDTAA